MKEGKKRGQGKRTKKERKKGRMEDGPESVGDVKVDTAPTSGFPTVYLGSEVLGPAQ